MTAHKKATVRAHFGYRHPEKRLGSGFSSKMRVASSSRQPLISFQ